MRQPISHHYDQLTDKERFFVDDAFNEVCSVAKQRRMPLAGDDRIARAVDALARAVIESRVKSKPTGIWPDWGDSPRGFDGPGGAE